MDKTRRTLRSPGARADLYLSYDGKCAICHLSLPKRWHADHRVPYIMTGSTEIENMQPTCPNCNLRKGKKMDFLKKTNDEYEQMSLARHISTDKLRRGQIGGINCMIHCAQGIVDGTRQSKTISIVEPCGAGKTLLIIASAYELAQRGLISKTLIITPSTLLRNSMASRNQLDEVVTTCKLSEGLCSDVLDSLKLPAAVNGEHFVVLTTQLLAFRDQNCPDKNNANRIAQWIKQEYEVTKKPVLVVIDECQSNSTRNCSDKMGNSWGQATETIINTGAAIVALFTATPKRDDGLPITGFAYNQLSRSERVQKVIRKHPDGDSVDKILIDTYLLESNDLELLSDYEYESAKACQDKVISRMDYHKIEVTVDIQTEDGQIVEKRSCDLTPEEVRKNAGKFTRNLKVIHAHAEKSLELMDLLRISEPRVQMIVFAGSDIEGEDNGHPLMIKNVYNQLDSSKKVVIVTDKMEEDPETVLRRFKNGDGDILVVKQMASVGLNIPSIRISVFLSAIRTGVSFIQMNGRAGRVWVHNGNSHEIGHIVMMDDVILRSLFEFMVKGEGFDNLIHTNSTLYSTVEADKKDVPSVGKVPTEVKKAEATGSLDLKSDSDVSKYDEENWINPYLDVFPEDARTLLRSEILRRAKRMDNTKLKEDAQFARSALAAGRVAKTVVQNHIIPESRNTEEELKNIRRKYNEVICNIVKLKYDVKLSPAQYKSEIGLVHGNAKALAGWTRREDGGFPSLDDEKSIEATKHLLTCANDLYESAKQLYVQSRSGPFVKELNKFHE